MRDWVPLGRCCPDQWRDLLPDTDLVSAARGVLFLAALLPRIPETVAGDPDKNGQACDDQKKWGVQMFRIMHRRDSLMWK